MDFNTHIQREREKDVYTNPMNADLLLCRNIFLFELSSIQKIYKTKRINSVQIHTTFHISNVNGTEKSIIHQFISSNASRIELLQTPFCLLAIVCHKQKKRMNILFISIIISGLFGSNHHRNVIFGFRTDKRRSVALSLSLPLFKFCFSIAFAFE